MQLRPSLLIYVGVLVLLSIASLVQQDHLLANLERIHALRVSKFDGSTPVAAIEEFALRWGCDDAESLCRHLLAPIARATGETGYLERYPADQPGTYYLIQAGWAYMMNGDSEQAANYFRRAPQELDRLLFQLGYSDQRIAETFIALNRAPALTHELGRLVEEAGKLELAKSAYRAVATGTTPDAPLHYLALGDQFLLDNNLDAAQDAYRESLTREPSLRQAFQRLIGVLNRQGAYKEVVFWAEERIRQFPDDADPYADAALAYGNMGQYAPGLELAIQARERFPDKVLFPYVEGYLHQQGGDCQLALAAFQSAIDIDPNYMLAHLGMARCYVTQGSYDLAAHHYTSALSLDTANRALVDEVQRFLAEHLNLP